MAAARYTPEMRRQVGSSPRPKGRENKDTLCRNVLIYGHCRYEDQGCTFNHDQNKTSGNQNDYQKKSLNVESPSFTPSTLQQPTKKSTFTTQAASAAVFTPRGAGSATPALPQAEVDAAAAFNPAAIREFTPQNYDQASTNGASPDNGLQSYDPFTMSSMGQALPAAQFNPYANDHNNMAAGHGSAYYQGQAGYAAPLQPLQYHLYAPLGPHKEDLLTYQRVTHDFFMPEKLREELQKKTHAALQVMPNSQLPQLDNYHSLVPLDATTGKNASIFGCPSWVYKATSTKTGRLYCLRRLEGYRLTNENAIRSVKEWKRIDNGNVVTTHDAFTTRAFGDSSLIFAQDYHPLSKTLAEHHVRNMQGPRYRGAPIAETTLWNYIVQLANALKAIHSASLAARCIDLSKIILTDKNRIRLDACGILDVVQFEARRPLGELQQEDFFQLGRMLLSLAANTPAAQLNSSTVGAALDQFARAYSPELKDTVTWLLTPAQPGAPLKSADDLIRGVSHHVAASYDMALHAADSLTSELYREVENGRLARLLLKLGSVNERHEYDGDPAWSENGERYTLKLFRDYVFHRVDEHGHPVLDMGHMLRALNKLDAGTGEMVRLTSRDGEADFIVTYAELKKQLASAFGDLQKGSRQQQARGGF